MGRDRDILAIQKKRPPAWRGPGQVKPGPLRQLGRASETASRAVMLGSYSRQQPHIGAALMQVQPALLDSAPDAGAELRAACLERVEEWVVDLLDMDSAVLYCLDARSQLNELTRGDYGIGKKAFGDVLHRWNQI